LRELENIGVTKDQIGLIVSDNTRGIVKKDNETEEGFSTSARAGGIFGAVISALCAATAMAVPDVISNFLYSPYTVNKF
jgi:hypothetical protein